ncbi:MAG TPA: hypothetical protein VLG36_03125 [Candidatus Chromulinivoraceae bacterium]|nr:hypothetical protein [Candidatus Chromulinivoraceae bacterium]
MKRDFLPTTEQPNHNPGSDRVPSHELERAKLHSLETEDGVESNPEVVNIMQLLLERGATVEPGTQIIESPFDDDMLYDVTHFYGVETELPQGTARYTVRAWERTFSDEDRVRIIGTRDRLGLPSDSHEEFLRTQGAKGILVVSSLTDKADGNLRKSERTLSYVQHETGVPAIIHTESGEFNPNIPESLTNLLVTPEKLSGDPITLEDARLEGDITRKEFKGDPEDTFVKRALGKIGIRRRKA